MRWITQFFHRGRRHGSKVERRRTCPHVVLAPRWARNEDIGRADRATGYWCAACDQELTVQQAAALQQPVAKAA